MSIHPMRNVIRFHKMTQPNVCLDKHSCLHCSCMCVYDFNKPVCNCLSILDTEYGIISQQISWRSKSNWLYWEQMTCYFYVCIFDCVYYVCMHQSLIYLLYSFIIGGYELLVLNLYYNFKMNYWLINYSVFVTIANELMWIKYF